MIYYSPVDGDVRQQPVVWRNRTAFIMQQLGSPIPKDLANARRCVDRELKKRKYEAIDAASFVAGKDFLVKIWNMVLGCPIGIAIVHEEISPATLANIYYELGMLQAYGRETLVVKVGKPTLPSDMVRTEYVNAGKGLANRLAGFLDSLQEREAYYRGMASLMDNDPLRAVDYLRRAAVLGGDPSLASEARTIWDASSNTDRTKTSVEELALTF